MPQLAVQPHSRKVIIVAMRITNLEAKARNGNASPSPPFGIIVQFKKKSRWDYPEGTLETRQLAWVSRLPALPTPWLSQPVDSSGGGSSRYPPQINHPSEPPKSTTKTGACVLQYSNTPNMATNAPGGTRPPGSVILARSQRGGSQIRALQAPFLIVHHGQKKGWLT